jgi:hypothetical protein
MSPQQQAEFNQHVRTHFASMMALALCSDAHSVTILLDALEGTWLYAHKAGRIAQHDSDVKAVQATSIPMGARANEIGRLYAEVVRDNPTEDN